MNAKLIYTFYTVPYDGANSSTKGFSVIVTHLLLLWGMMKIK